MAVPTDGLSGKVIVITGGSGILCKAMAAALAARGASIALLNRDAAKGQAAAAEVQAAARAAGSAGSAGQASPKVIALSCDVLDRQALMEARTEIHRHLGPCDILVNGAGGNNPAGTTATETWDATSAGFPPGSQGLAALPPSAGQTGPAASFFHLDPLGFDQVFRLNFMGTLLPSQVFTLDMLGRQGCCIINISSMASFSPMTKVPAYGAAKAAVNNFTQWMAVHFAPEGIRVNAIAPGFFSTEQNKTLLWNPDGSPTPRTGKILAHTPLGRLGSPGDLGGTVVWLADATASGFVSGVVVPVDGGFMAYSGV